LALRFFPSPHDPIDHAFHNPVSNLAQQTLLRRVGSCGEIRLKLAVKVLLTVFTAGFQARPEFLDERRRPVRSFAQVGFALEHP